MDLSVAVLPLDSISKIICHVDTGRRHDTLGTVKTPRTHRFFVGGSSSSQHAECCIRFNHLARSTDANGQANLSDRRKKEGKIEGTTVTPRSHTREKEREKKDDEG